MRVNLFLRILFVAIFALIVNIFIYFAFGNVFSAVMFNEKSFFEQYYSGVYRYRVFSNFFILRIYLALEHLPFAVKINSVYFWDKNTNPNMFLAYAVYNTFFLTIGNIILLLITETKCFLATNTEKILVIAVATFAIGISQFIIVPYDCCSYFFLFAFIYFFLKYLEKNRHYLLLVLFVILAFSTSNRESSALSLSFAAIVLYNYSGISKANIFLLMYFTVCYLLVYFGIRFYFGGFDVNNETFFWENFTVTRNLFGILFWVVFFVFSLLISNNTQNAKNIFIFHIISLPYIIMCFYTGVLYEIRLYIPIFLSCLVISKLSINEIKIN